MKISCAFDFVFRLPVCRPGYMLLAVLFRCLWVDVSWYNLLLHYIHLIASEGASKFIPDVVLPEPFNETCQV